jgi:hypothetical protein
MATENGSQATIDDSIKKLFDAMDIIAAQQIKNLQFDKTVKCSITDDSKSEQGEYTVTDGSSTFKAYSESTKYSNGASVYVNIPNGDYNNKKLITGRYDQDRKDYNTNDPEKSYIDITQNLISSSIGETGIIANGEKTQITIWDSGDNFNKKLEEEKDDTKKDEGIKYKAYKKMLVKAKFKNYLATRNVILGNYGIRIDILGEKKNTAEQTVEDWYMFKLDSSSMIGDPYKFEVGFEQKLLFDLDPDVNITRVRVVLYQDKNFYDKSKNLLAPSNFDDIFVSEPFVSFGYSLEDFTEDTVLLYTFDSKKYAEHLTPETKEALAKQSEIEHQKDNTKQTFTVEDLDKTELYTEQLNKLNKKKIILRWVHETTSENEKTRSFESIAQEEDIPTGAIVHWYKYDLTQGVTDKIAGAFWVEMVEQKNKFELEYSPNPKKSFEMFRVVVECMSREYVNNYLIANDEDILEIENKPEDKRTDEEKEKLDNLKNSYLEKIHDYISKDLKFENENMVPDENTIDLIKGLTITCDDGEGGYNGVYRIYNDSGQIMSSSEATKSRILTAKYTSIVSGVAELDTAEKITWSIPLENTMIYRPTEDTDYSFYDKVGNITQEDWNKKTVDYFTYSNTTKKYTKVTSWDERDVYYKKNRTQVEIKDNYFQITRYGVKPDKAAGTEEADSTQQYFRIKEYYTQSAINNTVYCTITKNNRTYTAEFSMVFGPVGTNGTDFTFTLEFDNKQPAITSSEDSVTIIPKVYDYQNKDVTEKYISKISYKWYSFNGDYYEANKKNAIEIGEINEKTGAVTLTLNSHNMEDLNYFILQGKVSNAVNIQNLKKYDNSDNKDKTVDGKVEVDKLVENTGSNKKGVDISLYTYLPIPVRRTDEYTTFDGATRVSYNTSGVDPQYYKDPYVIYHYADKKTSSVENINWMMSFGKDTRSSATGATNLKYYPTLDSDHKLIPPSMFLQDNGKEVSVIGFSFGSSGIQLEWIQPLYIYQNVFSSSLLNSWDGSLTFDEENGTILSTMMGAGKKDSQNRFNGVLMGDLSPAFETEEGVKALSDYYSGIGLYGFNAGQKSFGLNINGRAFFGKSGKGQILIDGNSGTIQSQHFLASMKKFYNDEEGEPTDVKKAGMRIDLDNGILETYGLNSTAMIKIDPSAGGKDGQEGNGAYFVVRSSAGDNSDSTDELDQETEKTNKKGTEIFYAGKKKYFLQSHNYTKQKMSVPAEKTDAEDDDFPKEEIEYGRGINFDLMKGKLNAFNFTLTATDASTGAYVKLNSENTNSGNPYFVIHGVKKDESGNVVHANNLLYFSNKIQRMRSLDYNTHDETGTEINLTNGKITSYDFNLKAVRKNQGIQMSSSGSPFLLIKARENPDDEKSASKTLVYITNSKDKDGHAQFYLQSKDYSSTHGSEAGVRFDLGNNKITAYDFNITAYHPYTDKDGKPQRYTLRIDSGQNDIPFQVGTRFKVHWDGEVEADFIKATAGKIGPFTFNKNALYTGTGDKADTIDGPGVYLGAEGLGVASGKFKADKNGNISLTGAITGTKWSVDSAGKATFDNINATGGLIAGWTIGNGYLENGSTKLSASGLDFSGGHLHANELKFGGVTLTNSKLSIGSGVELSSLKLTMGSGVELSASGLNAGANVSLNASGLTISGASLTAGVGGGLLTGGSFFVGNNLYVTGGAQIDGTLIVGKKPLGDLAFENSVKKKVNVTLTKEVSYAGQATSCSTTVHISWSVNDKNELQGGPWVNSGAGNRGFDAVVTATGTSPGGSKTVTITATGAEVEISPKDKGTANLSNGSFSSVTLS